MINRWTNERLGQSLIAIGVASLIFILSLNFTYGFILAPFAIMMLVFALAYPYLFGILFFILSLFRFHEIIPGLYSLHLPLFFAILGILSLSINAQLGRVKIYWRREMTYFMLFFVWVSTSMVLAYSLQTSFDYWKDTYIKIFIAFFMITWTVTSEKAYKLIVSLIVLSGISLSLLTHYYFAEGKHLVEVVRATLGGYSAIADPNDLALTLLFPFSFCCSMAVSTSSSVLIRFSGFFGAIIIIGAIFETQSRGGLMALIVIISYFATHQIKPKSLVIFLTMFMMLLFYLFTSSLFVRVGSLEPGTFDESAMGRIYAWEAAINMAIHHPVFGVGINGFQDNYYNYAIVWDNQQHAVHSSWLGVLAESGFIGLILFICCVIAAIKTAQKNIVYITEEHLEQFKQKTIYPILARGLYSGLIGFCISSTFLTQGFTWPFYIFFALTIALAQSIDTTIADNVGKA
ncbi:O-antigen ligase family protein [Fluoribacter gormanii]|uniref:Lipid A core - O-antigen ligase and related enzymes n=1 Tax=Fluoribacter gormanii TaxID=464 RepID=A0A377GNR6_9GAMM|nr:O-antigen ligase family protein [Fluoribacter gormanii]KTD04747.1 O-Antigen ligase [Fluoribacter gormanii]MCW8445383.1 O-antigen ligase family protein [Fluoribacter gormanii]MCW8470588.1 O-antigen ligase family protein [Fluoribacter gormanii]SIR15295.1 probable O-glycosylation ligase, exosortase A-associated [Fluoribacter gormanii]STO26253.1 Lipid A core - O-antigen ligase and related enzymes [Fluoribacter gormanii]